MNLAGGVGLALVVATVARGDFSGAHAENHGDLGAGANTWRLYLDFTSPADQLVGIFGTVDRPLTFETWCGDPLRNTAGPFAGTHFEDIPFPGNEAWDSWVTIGTDTPFVSDVEFTPGFLGGDGSTSVIHGTSFSESNGGWFDSDPGTAETGESILIAQFTIRGFEFGGNVSWIGRDGVEMTSELFTIAGPLKCTPLPAPGTFVALALPWLVARRRRG